MIIEDHEDVRSFIRRSLERDNCVVEAWDGREGLGVVRRHMPDVVVSDAMMPGLDGCRSSPP